MVEAGKPAVKEISHTRYRQKRILVRGLRRLQSETRSEFKSKVVLLRRHFQQFNVDVSEICQWLMSLRPGAKLGAEATEPFWKFLLDPGEFLSVEDDDADRIRRLVFTVTAGWQDETHLTTLSLPHSLVESIRHVAGLPHTYCSQKLFTRLCTLNPAHLQILLKAAAEWIVARYWRGLQNWERQHEAWEQEKKEWENSHPELTDEARHEFNGIFRELQVRDKRPRVCSWERLKAGKNDCEYAGQGDSPFERRHNSLCVKYRGFTQSLPGNRRKLFVDNAKILISWPKHTAMNNLLKKRPQATAWFPHAWTEYLQALALTEDSVRRDPARLPHCVSFAGDCQFSPHTDLCNRYRKIISPRPDLQKLDKIYRAWRSEYLSGPNKPSFRYPSAGSLPLPKIFGSNFFKAHFDNSILHLRLDDMPEGQFLPFGFKPWPADYEPQPQATNITSVHINFAGTRARAGFHFEIPHKSSRFNLTQDEIDYLRSRRFPRQAQDKQFLEEAHQLLMASFMGNADQEMRLLAVDLGQTGAATALYIGRHFQKAAPLKIIKIDHLYDAPPDRRKEKKTSQPASDKQRQPQKGLSKDHVGLHLQKWAQGASAIGERRHAWRNPGLRDHDMRRLSIHIAAMIRDWVRLNASQIMKQAEYNAVDLIVFESLRGFAAPGRDKLDADKKRRLAFFPYGSIRRKVTEKAVERGMRVVTVPYLYSSMTCSDCGKTQSDRSAWRRNKNKSIFRCERCELECHSDENAARVLARVFWGEIALPVTQPDLVSS